MGTPATNSPLFRVRQQWSGEYPAVQGLIQISALYPGAGRYGWQEVGADTEPKIFLMPVPDELVGAGFSTRLIAIRLSSRTRTYEGANWIAHIDQWIS